MNILINALSSRGGGQTYLSNLLKYFPNEQDKVIVLSSDALAMPSDKPNIYRYKVADYVIHNPIIRSLWEAVVLPFLLYKLNIDILFCPGSLVSWHIPRNCKVVTTFQNMRPFNLEQCSKYPLGYMYLRIWLLRKGILKGFLKSDLIIFISNYALSVVKGLIGDKLKLSVVIPHGIDNIFRAKPNHPLARPTWLLQGDYLLYVSTIDIYKAQLEVVSAYALLKQKGIALPKLILLGDEYAPYAKQVRAKIKEHKLTEDILIKTAIAHEELPAVYQNALINIFASQTENCPFTLLEAMASNRPLLVSSKPPMTEFAKDAVIYFNPDLPTDLAAKLELLLLDTNLQYNLAMAAYERSMEYNWHDAAAKTWESVRSLQAV